jgi:hypothetical protein
MSKDEKTLFLACPIGENNSPTRHHADSILTHLIQDTIDRHQEFEKIKVIRADKLAQPGKITTQIIQQLTDSDVLIGDLTDLNPNVLYELGIRQAILKPYILIANHGTKLPFDLQDSRTIFFDLTNLDSMLEAKTELQKHLREALNGKIDPYDANLFGPTKPATTKQRTDDKSRDLRIMETLDGIIEAEKTTSNAVDSLSRRLSKAVNQIESLFTTRYGGAGSYLYINGEHEAFSALVAALSRAKDSVRTTRFSPFAVGTRQTAFARMIHSRVLGDDHYPPVQRFTRVVAANNMNKIEDVKEYFREFLGKQFTLFLTPHSNNFELVIIDQKEVFIHFHGRDKIIDSTLHIIGEEVAKKFTEIYSALHDPLLLPQIKKYDFKYISRGDTDTIIREIENYFIKWCTTEEDNQESQ